MDDENIEDNESQILYNGHYNPQLISIRKNLIAPNNILPGQIIRSHSPRHLLRIKIDFQSQAGHRMLLDTVEYESHYQFVPKNKEIKTKNFLTKQHKKRSKSEMNQIKRKEQYKQIEINKLPKDIENVSILDFLKKNLKNILNYPENITFISKSALIGLAIPFKIKYKKDTEKIIQQQRNQQYINYLRTGKYFCTSAYTFDQSHNQEEFESLQKYENYDQYLQFDDNFQSSNIFLVMKCEEQHLKSYKKQKEYYNSLYFINVRLDYNTKSYGQWFYFKVTRRQRSFSFSRNGNNYFKFMIINMTKNASLFGKGLKISVCRNGVWRKEGLNIRYYQNNLRRQDSFQGSEIMFNQTPIQTFYTLQFILQIFQGQQIYISYNQPYTYTRLGKLLDKIITNYQNNTNNILDIKRNILCQTYLNNSIQCLTFSAKNIHHQNIAPQQKKIIFIMGRTHPIQTAGSHVIEGILNDINKLFLQDSSENRKNHIVFKLLQHYVIKIIPMVNPDGVILGNSRCNLAGYDLNRSWKLPKIEKSKEILCLKKYILQYQKRIEMFIDLHAHSKKKNVFAYGCHDISNPFSTRQFPFLLSKLSENDFLFKQCRFTKLSDIKKTQGNFKRSNKDGTARIFLYDYLRIPNVFTIQNSYCSAKDSSFHYDKYSYEIIGADILKAISLYFSPNFKKNENFILERHYTNDERKPRFNQSRVKIELNSSFYNDIELKLAINPKISDNKQTQSQINRYVNANELRQKYLFELHKNESNITMGLINDCSASQSQEEERIYEVKCKKRQKISPDHEIKKTQRQSIIQNSNHRNTNLSKFTNTSNKKSTLNISSTHSQTNLAQLSKVTKTKFRTLTKPLQSIIPSENIYELDTKRQKSQQKIQSPNKTRFPTDIQTVKGRKDNFLSIVQIGVGKQLDFMNEKAGLLEKIQIKQKLKTVYNFKQQRNRDNQYENILENNKKFAQFRDDEIKQYLRKIMKPKPIIERQKVQTIKQKAQRLEKKIQQSNTHFNDLKLSKLIVLQNSKKTRIHTQRSII